LLMAAFLSVDTKSVEPESGAPAPRGEYFFCSALFLSLGRPG